MLSTLWPARCYQHDAAGPQSHKLWHLSLVVSSGVCWWQETTTKCLWQEFLTLRHKTTEHHLIACNNKSVAYVSNNKRLCSTFCNIEAHYWQIQSIAQPLCDSGATCNQTWQVHITVHAHCVTATQMHKVEGQDHTRPKIELETWRRHRSRLLQSSSFSNFYYVVVYIC